MSVSRFALVLVGALAAAPAFARADTAPEATSRDDVTYPEGMAHASFTSAPAPVRAADSSRSAAPAEHAMHAMHENCHCSHRS